MLHFELLILGLVASSDLLHLIDGLVLFQNVVVFCFQVFFQRVSFSCQLCHRLSEAVQLRLS